MLDQILAFTFHYRSLQKNVYLNSRGSVLMSPCRYACCLCAKARNEILGLLRQRKLLNSRKLEETQILVFLLEFLYSKEGFCINDFSHKGVASQDTRVCVCVCKGGEG